MSDHIYVKISFLKCFYIISRTIFKLEEKLRKVKAQSANTHEAMTKERYNVLSPSRFFCTVMMC